MSRQRVIGLVHNIPASLDEDNHQASADVMVQVEAIEEALSKLGHRPVRLPFTRDVGRFADAVDKSGAQGVFNLCETVEENPRLAGHPAAVLELLNIPFTGSDACALAVTTDKYLMKQILHGAGIDTPAFCLCTEDGRHCWQHLRFPLILKPRFEDASIGIDQESVVGEAKAIEVALGPLLKRYGEVVIEEYVDGREINISLFGYDQARVLPPAEIDLSGYPEKLYKIVGYRAKWVSESVEYQQSRRIFPAPSAELEKMGEIAERCFCLFGLRDYGRVDFRLDGDGRIWVLEINANPCLSPDAGFPAALQEIGTNFEGMVSDFLGFLNRRSP